MYQTAQAVKIPIIGIGGIASYEDALEFILAGASAVQIGTMSFVDPSVWRKTLDGLPAAFSFLATLRALLAIAHHLEPVGGNSQRLEILHRGSGAPLTEGQVVLIGTPIVAVAFDLNDGGVVAELEPVGIVRQRRTCVIA